jgi:SAM-dependent methyltransferase
MSDEQRSVVFDRAADFYDATRGFPPGVETRAAALVVQAGGLGATSRVLEVGVGTGRVALPLAALVANVVGVDLSLPMLRHLVAKRDTQRVAVTRADVVHLPFPAARFDAVLGVHFFHLVPRWREALAEVARVLRRGAPLLLGADEPQDAWAHCREELAACDEVDHPGVSRGRFFDFPADAGWRPLGERHSIAFPRRIRPRQILERLAERSWSITWSMSDAQIERAVEALRPELVARFGDLDAEAEVEGGFSVQGWLAPE